MSQVNKAYATSIYGLLHDVGKPILRVGWRYHEGLEPIDKETAERIRRWMDIHDLSDIVERKMTHEQINKFIIEDKLRLTIPREVKVQVEDIVMSADAVSAAERGLESGYQDLVSNLEKAGKHIAEKLHEGGNLNISTWSHHTVPFLSPTWMALKSDYRAFVGPGRKKGPYADAGRDKLRGLFGPIIQAIENREHEEFLKEQIELLKELSDKKLWLPIEPLSVELLHRRLKAFTLGDAINNISYAKVVLRLITGLDRLLGIYTTQDGTPIGRGLADSVLYLMRSAALFVPSAVFGSIVPDISLFSHSRFTAALASAFALGGREAALVALDANGIQSFVSSPMEAAAATRVMRGRSMLVQLALDALANYALELFGLTEASLLIDGGGALTLAVPYTNDIDNKLDKLRDVAWELSLGELGGALEFTIARSRRFDKGDASYIHALETERGFVDVVKTYEYNLTIEKAKRQSRVLDVVTKPDDIADYDALTWEVVRKDVRGTLMGLRVCEENREYVDDIAGPEKLSTGDTISSTTHVSLVLGTTLRNLAAIISLHAYKREKDVAIEPDGEFVSKLCSRLIEKACGVVGYKAPEGALLCKGYIESVGMRIAIGLVPLPSTGSLYITLAIDTVKPLILEAPDAMEEPAKIWTVILILLGSALEAIRNARLAAGEQRRLLIEVKLVNAFENFLPPVEERGIRELVEAKIKNMMNELAKEKVDVDLSFGFVFVNTYHPVEEKDGLPILMGLDRFELIGLFKLDVDLAGELVRLVSFSPSRLITFSDLVNIALLSKAYIDTLYTALGLYNRDERAMDLIPLYAGGDDIVCYGSWTRALYGVARLLRAVSEILHPLTASAALIIDRSKAPVLDMYRDALSCLDDAKKHKASLVLLTKDYWVDIESNDGKDIPCTLNVLEATEGAWPADRARQYIVRPLEELFDPMRSEELRGLDEYKTLVHALSMVGHDVQRLIGKEGKPLVEIEAIKRLRLEVMYAYLWSRRGEDLKKLVDKLRRNNIAIKGYPHDIKGPGDLIEALRALAYIKPLLDVLLLALRRPEDVRPPSIRWEKAT